jgi:putative ABC transport system permease protein
VDRVGADLWIVQGGTRGPFAEMSRIPATLEDRVHAVPGVASARRSFPTPSSASIEGKAAAHGRAGLVVAGGSRRWIPLVAGRPLRGRTSK